MAGLTYHIVEHNGGFAYKVGDVFSETFATHDAALNAARSAADRQQAGVDPHMIEYQDASGKWRTETASAGVRTDVEDDVDPSRTPRAADGSALDEDDLPNPDRAPLDVAGKVFNH